MTYSCLENKGFEVENNFMHYTEYTEQNQMEKFIFVLETMCTQVGRMSCSRFMLETWHKHWHWLKILENRRKVSIREKGLLL